VPRSSWSIASAASSGCASPRGGHEQPRPAHPDRSGIAGHVATTGEILRIEDAYADPRFNPEIDRQTGFRTRSILCVPLADSRGEVFAVAQLLNRRDGQPFEARDERRFAEFAGSIAVLLETWSKLAQMRPSG
jgi:putative ABC transport system ATP-binding protein